MLIGHFIETVQAGHNQYPGSRPESVEEKVSILDPSSSSRGKGDCEGQVGCPDGSSGLGPMGKDEGGSCGTNGQIEPPLFFVDITGSSSSWEPFGVYVRATETILGDEKTYPSVSLDLGTSRCFNCGSPDHVVSACPTPLDRPLISLSRQLFNFIQASRGVTDFQRIHVVEEWRRQRLQWLDTFEPGEIRGSLLQDAIGADSGEWLKNMAIWGYPKGWVGVTDPKERVRQLIESEHADHWSDEVDDFQPFLIFGDSNEVETVCSNGADRLIPSNYTDSDASSDTSSPSMEDIPDLEFTHSTPPQPIRWAQYPDAQFASHLLPVYSGTPLPPVSHRGSSTYTTDRQELWQRIITGEKSPLNDALPWRLPGAFERGPPASQGYARDYGPIPPPPTTEPPPLPPPPPPLHLDRQEDYDVDLSGDDGDGSDMDMSD